MTKYILEKIKVGSTTQDVIANTTADNVIVNKNNGDVSLASELENINLAISNANFFATLFSLYITFHSAMKGKTFTVTGGNMDTYTGTVPDTLVATVYVPTPATYTIVCGNYKKIITTGISYGVYPAHVNNVSTVLSENSWEQIAAVSASGDASDYWNIGDEIDIVVNGETLTLQIYGFNQDDLTGGGKAGITFGMKNLMATTKRMDATNTNANSFVGSEMFTWLQGTLLPSLPIELQPYIKSVDKKTSAGSQSTTINTESMKLFLFSAIENGLRLGTAVYQDEGETYPIFTNNASRVKYLANGTGSANGWWERSPHATTSAYFCYVNSVGSANTNGASLSYGVCFGFCI